MLLAAKNKPSNWRRVRYLDLSTHTQASAGSGRTPGSSPDSSKAPGGKTGKGGGGVRFAAVAESETAADDEGASEDELSKALAAAPSQPPPRVPGRSMAKRGSVVNGQLLSELDEIENDPHK
jgi:hypothetical protein